MANSAWISATGTGLWSNVASWNRTATSASGDTYFGNTSTAIPSTYAQTSGNWSASAVIGIATINAVALQVSSVSAGIPTGITTVMFGSVTAGVTSVLATCTINSADLNYPYGNGWYTFVLNTPITTTNGKGYAVGVSSSVASSVNLYRGATVNDWNKAYRTNITGSPVAGDRIFILPQMVSAGVSTKDVLTYDSGSGALSASQYSAINIGPSANLLFLTTTTTNIGCSGAIQVWGYGKWEMGNAGNPVSATVSACITLTCSANNSAPFVAQAGSVINMYGQPMAITNTLLNNDFVTGATLSVVDNTGWRVGDSFVVGGTASLKSARYYVSSTGVGSIVATTNAINGHSGSAYSSYAGTFDARADVFNLSRNVYITTNVLSASTNASSFNLNNPLSANINYVEFANVGLNCSQNSSGTSNVLYSTFHDCFNTIGPFGAISISGVCTNFIFSNNFTYNTTSNGVLGISNTTQGNFPYPVFTNNILCGPAIGNFHTIFASSSAIFCNNVLCDYGGVQGLFWWDISRPALWYNLSGNVLYNSAEYGIYSNQTTNWFDYSLTAIQFSYWRIYNVVSMISYLVNSDIVFSSCTGFALNGWFFNAQENYWSSSIVITNCLFTSSIPSSILKNKTTNVFASSLLSYNVIASNTCFGVSGSFSGYTNTDFNNNTALGQTTQIKCYSCSSETLQVASQLAQINTTAPTSFISFQNHQGVIGNNFSYWRGGKISRSTANCAAGFSECVALTPNIITGATIPLRQTYQIPIQANTTRTITVYMMVTNTYTGANPQLSIEYNGQVVSNQQYVLSATPNSYSACLISVTGSNFPYNGGVQLDVDAFGNTGQLYIQYVTFT